MMHQTTAFHVRAAGPQDASALIALMWQLAIFENYVDHFKVREADLLEQGLDSANPCFHALVAVTDDNRIMAYAVCYEVRFTYDLKPTWHLKELYVKPEFRGNGIGSAVFEAVKITAKGRGAARLKWDVLPSNEAAKTFYRQHGGRPVTEWDAWICALA